MTWSKLHLTMKTCIVYLIFKGKDSRKKIEKWKISLIWTATILYKFLFVFLIHLSFKVFKVKQVLILRNYASHVGYQLCILRGALCICTVCGMLIASVPGLWRMIGILCANKRCWQSGMESYILSCSGRGYLYIKFCFVPNFN
jgi:hypothetical protein